MKNIIKKRRFAETFFVLVILGIFLVIPTVCAIGVSSDYNNDNHATASPGETKVIDLVRLLSGAADSNNGSVQYKAELIDGAGVATLEGNGEYSVIPTKPGVVQVKVIIPDDAVDGTSYTLQFRFTDITPAEGGGMISFDRSTTYSMPIYVKTSAAPPAAVAEKPKGSIAWVIIVIALALIIAIVAFLLLRKKRQAQPTP
jgi:hypothetical protein